MSDDVLVLWDIDGTLLNAGGVGRDLYGDVFLQLFGRPLTAHLPMSGRTDRAIILETLELAGVDEPRRHVDPFIASLGTHAQAVHAAVAERGQALPGAAEALAAVAAARSFGSSQPVGSIRASGVPARGVSTLSLPEPEPASPSTRSSAFAPGGPGAAAPLAPAAAPAMAATRGTLAGSPAAAQAVQAAHTAPATVTMTPAATQAATATVSVAPVAVAAVNVAAPAGPVIGAPVASAAALAPQALGSPAPGAPAGAAPSALAPPPAAAALAQLVPPQAGAVRARAPHRPTPAVTSRRAAPPRAGGATGGRGKRRVYQSVLTGSIRPVAEMKLAALGLRDGLDLCIGAYGDDHEDRTQLVHVARRRAAGVHGQSAADFSGSATVIVGDTPLDVTAALEADARVVGVASGAYTEAELREAGAQTVLPDLTDTDAVLLALFG